MQIVILNQGHWNLTARETQISLCIYIPYDLLSCRPVVIYDEPPKGVVRV